MYQVLIQDNINGKVYDVTDYIASASMYNARKGSAGKLEFVSILDIKPYIGLGYVVDFKLDGNSIFYGYIFQIDQSRDKISLICYDQIRYLLNNYTYVFKNKRADEIISIIAGDFNLVVGDIPNTGYIIPILIEDNQTLLDIIQKALDLTLINTGEMYHLYDNLGAISVKNVTDTATNLIIGDESLLVSYGYSESIDKDTYNSYKILRNNEETGARDSYIYIDSNNIEKWGILQYLEIVNDDLNSAQVQDRLDTLSELKNKPTKTLTVGCVGDIRIKAGDSFYMKIDDLDLNIRLLVNNSTHRFNGVDHIMELELRLL